jgi:MtN3 and saliva related transmembrane protein
MEILIEGCFSLSLFINAALFVPQVYQLFKTKNANDLSLLTFAGFTVIQLVVILHGFLHNDYLLVAGTMLSLLPCGMITALIVIYQYRRK